MANNTAIVNPTSAAAADPKPQQPVAPQPIQQPPNKGNKMLWIIVGLVVLILLIGGIYWYATSQQKVEPSPKPAAAPETVDTLERDLNTLSLDDLEAEFSTVDTDLQGL